jgi:predicted GIY-YIG superfamily endonuclease
MYYVYFLKNSRGDLYIGQTNNLSTRANQQISKLTKSAKFIKDSAGNFSLVYYEEYSTRLEAMHREKQLKGWTRAKKEALIAGDKGLLKKL